MGEGERQREREMLRLNSYANDSPSHHGFVEVCPVLWHYIHIVRIAALFCGQGSIQVTLPNDCMLTLFVYLELCFSFAMLLAAL